MTPLWDLRLGDCLDPVTGMASLGDKSVDHVITDPPYSRDLYASTRTNKGRPDLRHRSRRTAIELGNSRIGSIDDILPTVVAQIKRVCKRWAIVFSDAEINDRWRDEFGNDWYVRTGVWVKPDPMPQISADRPGQGHETVTICHAPGRKRWNGGGRAAVWWQGREQVGRPDHPCPKPIELMERMVRDFTDRDETILDMFCGSGTTLVAAVHQGRRAIGWERDVGYHAIAMKRLTAARQQFEMFPEPSERKPRAVQFDFTREAKP